MVRFLRSIEIFQNHKRQRNHSWFISLAFRYNSASFAVALIYFLSFFLFRLSALQYPFGFVFLAFSLCLNPAGNLLPSVNLKTPCQKMSMIECCGAKKVINVFGGCHLALVRNLCHLLGEVCTVSAKPRPPHKGLSAGIE